MKFTTFLSLIFISISLSAQEQYLFLPKNNSLGAYQYKNSKLFKLGSTEFQITKLYHIENDQYVITNSDSSGLIFGEFSSNGIRKNFEKKFPQNFHPISIFLFNEFIFVGGNWNSGDFFLVLDTKTENWTKINIPEEVYFPGKGIDDFFIQDSLLVAVDNIVTPKYLLFYDNLNLPNLELKKIFKLESNGSYESIHKATINEKFIVILSGTFGGYGNSTSNFVSILRKGNLKDGFSIESNYKEPYSYEYWYDVEIIKNKGLK